MIDHNQKMAFAILLTGNFRLKMCMLMHLLRKWLSAIIYPFRD